MSLDSRRAYEYKGVVDLIAVKRDPKDPDLLTIVLLQVKGGGARVTPAEIDRLRAATQRLKIRWAEHERQILRLLARGEREITAAKGYDLDDVLAEADRLLADA